ncbi:MAG: multicopper oxidase domain-containing protein [Gammaproteobacteria bacterium]
MFKHLLNLFLLVPVVALGATTSYEFDIDTVQLNVTGSPVEALAIDGQIPAPTISAAVGDTLRVTFHNHLGVTTSVHWHGILLPADQDGVPYLNTQPIAPGESHTFEFPILHDGTFWYHSHTDLQIQHGLYGAVVLKDGASLLPEDQVEDQVVVFSDWTDEDAETVLANLKKSDDFYAWKKGKVQSWDKVFANGGYAVRNRIDNALTRMGPMDLTDVGYDAYLVNGKRESVLPLQDQTAGQVKLRLVNGSTSSYFDLEYAGGPMTVVAADGQDVQPLRVQRLRIATAETYDVLVSVTPERAYELRATSFDGTGHSSLFVGTGERVAAPDRIPPNLYLMDHTDMSAMDMDMGMSMDRPADRDRASGEAMNTDSAASAMKPHDSHDEPGVNVEPLPMAMPADTSTVAENSSAQADHHSHADHLAEARPMPKSGRMAMAMPGEVIEHMTDYRYLAARHDTSLPDDQPWHDIELTLTGNMERYVWSFDGQTVRENPQVMIRAGENVRFHLTNDTMMHHPLHLHGHFFRIVNEQGERSPLKHTVNVPPMGHVVIEFNASEKADWLFHCHNQYHMKTGMNRVISYEQSSTFDPQMADLIVPSIRWFRINEFHLLTSFADYEFRVSDERHSFDLELDTDLDDTLELHLFYNYHFNRFVSAFGGLERREHHHGKSHDLPVAGLNILLPFMIDSEWRVDDHGRFRLELESQMHFTRRFGFDWRWNSDDEHRYGFSYRLSNRFSVTVHTDTEYGDGIGVQFFY